MAEHGGQKFTGVCIGQAFQLNQRGGVHVIPTQDFGELSSRDWGGGCKYHQSVEIAVIASAFSDSETGTSRARMSERIGLTDDFGAGFGV